jgi:hypothetical protein
MDEYLSPWDDVDTRRRAEIEEMMRRDRERYFRDEIIQQEYRDILDRQAAQGQANDKLANGLQQRPFDEALARFVQSKADKTDNPQSDKEAKSSLPPRTPEMLPELIENHPAAVAIKDGLPTIKEADLTDGAAVTDMSRNEREDQQDSLNKNSDQLRIVQNAFPISGAKAPDNSKKDIPLPLDGVDRVIELQSKVAPIRKGAIQQRLRDQLNYAAQETGLQVEIFSGGQPAIGESGPRTGSARHDHGHAADLKLFEFVNGKKRYLNSDNPHDRSRMQTFIQYAVTAGATGVGHAKDYMGTESIHIGGGLPLVWGRDGEAANALPWVKDAHSKGLAARQKILKEGAWPNR